MSAAVEILAPTSPKKAEKALEGVQQVSVVRAASQASRQRMLVAWLSDLDVATRRRELMTQVDMLPKDSEGTPFVLVNASEKPPRSYQALEMLTQWGARSGFYLAPDLKALRRMVRARLAGAEHKLIASALVEDGRLVVWSCEPRRYAVPANEIPALAGMTAKQLATFELNESGSRLRWNKADVDLGLDNIRYYTDPRAKREQDQARRQEAAGYAEVIRAFREEKGIKQSGVVGLTERQVRRVEQGESTPRSATLKKLAFAHGLTLDQYLGELAKRSQRSG